jgi:hypothetical protein
MRQTLLCFISLMILTACSPATSGEPDVIVEEPIEEEVLEEVIVWPYTEALTGLGTNEASSKAIAVMIGNTIEARPQSGLSQADIVYEIMVEYQVTRLMAIFSSQLPEKVGPMRSVRMPFVQKVEELKVGIAHYGGASVGLGDALGYLDKVKPPIRYDGVTGINTAYFSRDSARKAPHNAYMNVKEAIQKAPEMTLDVLRFEDQSRESDTEGTKLSLVYSKSYQPSYQYRDDVQKYQRYFNAQAQFDLNNDQAILVTNVIIQHVKHRIVEQVGYVLVDFIGSGKAEYYIQGHRYEGTWERAGLKDRTLYKDASGQEMLFQPGNTWIQVVLSSTKINYE